MKHHLKHLLALALLGWGTAVLPAQNAPPAAVVETPDDPAITEPATATAEAAPPSTPAPLEVSPSPATPNGAEIPAIGADMPPAEAPPHDTNTDLGADSFDPIDGQKSELEQTAEGYIIKDAGLNDIFQFLAKSAWSSVFPQPQDQWTRVYGHRSLG